MKEKLLLVSGALVSAVLLYAFTGQDIKSNTRPTPISCRPTWLEIETLLDEAEIPPIPGAGAHTWKIGSSSDSAEYYFNQGINMYYSFHIIEALASFKKGARFDPNSPLLQWGQALAYGPNINDFGYAASPEALITSRRALELSTASSAKDSMLIRAQMARYSSDSTQSRAHLNQLYVDEMKKAYEAYPRDAHVAALYADALMLQHPWDLWQHNGQPQPWTPAIRHVLEKLLAFAPNHPGANHYYIHVMEASPFYRLALPSADRLSALTPALAHTVHMPSHIYLRAGHYEKGVRVNEKAVASYREMADLFNPVTANDFLYIIHNLHMQTNNAMLAGRKATARQSANETRASVPEPYLSMEGGLKNMAQYIYHTPVFIDVKFGEWESLLKMEKPDASQVYSNIIYHFGKGMALSARSNWDKAGEQLVRLKNLLSDSVLYLPLDPFSPTIISARVAAHILEGSIALGRKNYEAAIAAFRKAQDLDESLVYNEPRDWLLNSGQYLGNAYFKAGRLDEAQATFEKDLARNNDNAWSLYGLYQVFRQKKKTKAAARTWARFKSASRMSDIQFPGAVY